jgi:hypothetical protein
MFHVILQLGNGEEADAGGHGDRAQAEKHVAELVESAESGKWLAVGDRFLQPAAVVSIDIREGRASTWRGSDSRSSWGEDQ